MFNLDIDPVYKDHLLKVKKEAHKEEALRKIAQYVHPKFLLEFADILLYGWQESIKSAEKLAESFDLNKLDFLSICEDEKEFEEEFENQMEFYYD